MYAGRVFDTGEFGSEHFADRFEGAYPILTLEGFFSDTGIWAGKNFDLVWTKISCINCHSATEENVELSEH